MRGGGAGTQGIAPQEGGARFLAAGGSPGGAWFKSQARLELGLRGLPDPLGLVFAHLEEVPTLSLGLAWGLVGSLKGRRPLLGCWG